MLIIAKITLIRSLILDAYSFDTEEINSVNFVLGKAHIKIRSKQLRKDEQERIGMRFTIKRFEISNFENILKLKFRRRGVATEIEFSLDEQGSSYKCQRIAPPPGCETIYADNDKEAMVKCA